MVEETQIYFIKVFWLFTPDVCTLEHLKRADGFEWKIKHLHEEMNINHAKDYSSRSLEQSNRSTAADGNIIIVKGFFVKVHGLYTGVCNSG